MNLDLKPMLRGEITRMPLDFTIEPEAPDGVTFEGDVQISGEITNQGGYMRLEVVADISYRGTCARCLADVSGQYSMPFERTVVTEGTLTDEQLEDNVDEYVVLCDGMLDIDDAVREAIILTFPMRLLCDEDCPGMCPKCGKLLREGACGCSTKEIDPRWAVLATLRFDEDEDSNSDSKNEI